jgi:glutathione S-transferase
MKLYYASGACSLGIHVLLNEVGADYELVKLDMRAGDLQKPEYLAVNPKGKVPAMMLDDGTILTEWPALATYIAATHARAHLISSDPVIAARTMEAVMYINGTVHLAGFSRVMRPAVFSPNPVEKDAVRMQGKKIFGDGLALVSATLGDQDYLMGDFSVADAALFYVTFWNNAVAKVEVPANINAHYDRMMARPAVQRAMVTEGLA